MTKPTNDTDLFREAQTGQDKREHQKNSQSCVYISRGQHLAPAISTPHVPLSPSQSSAILCLYTADHCTAVL